MSGNNFKSDLPQLHDYVSTSFIAYPKQLFIENLREFFSQDSYYHSVLDPWGFSLVNDHTNQPLEAGINDDVTTRLYIGESNKFSAAYYPSLLVDKSDSRSVPISFNRDKGVVQWKNILFQDGYGNEKIIKTPDCFVQNGAWEGTITVDVRSLSSTAVDELAELVSTLFVDYRADEMGYDGVVIKPGGINVSSKSDSDDRTRKFFKRTVSFEIRSEWRRKIPISNIVEIINFCVDIGNTKTQIYSPNIAISFSIDLADKLSQQ